MHLFPSFLFLNFTSCFSFRFHLLLSFPSSSIQPFRLNLIINLRSLISPFRVSCFSLFPIATSPRFYHLYSFPLYSLTENFHRCLPWNSCIPFPAVPRIDSGACHISLGGDMSTELLPTLEKSIPITFLALFPRILCIVCHFLKHKKDLSLLQNFRRKKKLELTASCPRVSVILCPENSCIFCLGVPWLCSSVIFRVLQFCRTHHSRTSHCVGFSCGCN